MGSRGCTRHVQYRVIPVQTARDAIPPQQDGTQNHCFQKRAQLTKDTCTNSTSQHHQRSLAKNAPLNTTTEVRANCKPLQERVELATGDTDYTEHSRPSSSHPPSMVNSAYTRFGKKEPPLSNSNGLEPVCTRSFVSGNVN